MFIIKIMKYPIYISISKTLYYYNTLYFPFGRMLLTRYKLKYQKTLFIIIAIIVNRGELYKMIITL
jgi:hypothetical protein